MKNSSPSSSVVSVLLPLPFSHPFSYDASSQETSLEPGALVSVPFGKQQVWGVVWPEDPSSSPSIPASASLKPISQLYEAPPLSPSFLSFLQWVARYTLTPLGKILKMALFSKALLPSSPKKRALREALLEEIHSTPVTLSPDQEKAASLLKSAVQDQKFHPLLLDGVTGSGKTEVYFEAIEQALTQNLQTLILLPEIALTTQWIQRFKNRFGFPPTQWHSDLTPTRRQEAWRAIFQGKTRVVVGARSALFLPFPQLGLIIVDEEHDPSYKQEEGVIYQGRDMAIVRAHLQKIPIILASATPSLETFHNAQQGRYEWIKLKNRHGLAVLPPIELIDLRHQEKKREFLGEKNLISPPLHQAILDTLQQKEQGLLFLNRRGFAPLTLCKSCGHRLHCPSCSVTLVDHRHRLLCHQCGHRSSKPHICPHCHEEDTLLPWGPGVERLADEVARRYPQARVAILSSDTLSGPKAMRDLIQQIEHQELDLIIGTQMIAKGYHFPQLTLVGVIDGDMGLSGGDPRASERTFQLLSQVAGRSGRGEKKGRVLIQSHMPDHSVMKALLSGDRDFFLTTEAQERQAYGLPPYGRLAALILSGKNALEVEKAARHLARHIPPFEGEVWGPAPAPLHLLRGKYRWRFLIKSPHPPQGFLHQWMGSLKLPRSLHLQIDVDPWNFL